MGKEKRNKVNNFDRISEMEGFLPDSVIDEIEPVEDTIPPQKSTSSIFDRINEMEGFSPDTMEEEVEEPEEIEIPETPEAPEPIAPETTEIPPPSPPTMEFKEPMKITGKKEPAQPVTRIEFEEPTEVKPSEISEPYVPPSPTPSYGTFGVPMAPPPAIKPQEQLAAYAHRGLAAGKQLVAPEVAKMARLQPTQEKREKQAKRATELPKEAMMHGKAAEILEPTWYTSEKIRERVDRIRGQDPNLANSFDMGDIVGAAEIALTNASMSGDETAINTAYETLKQAREVAGQLEKKRKDRKGFTGGAANVLEATAGILPMMGKGMAMNAIPVVGPALSTSMWAKQGAGDIIAELKEKGVPNDVALGYGLAGGIAYALVENIQIGQLGNIAVKKAIGESVKKKLVGLAKQKGIDWFKEVGEEGLQRIVTENTIINALKEAGVDVSREEMKERYKKAFTEDIKGSAWPMLILSLAGFGGGAAGMTYTKGDVTPQITEMVDEKTGKVTPIYQQERYPRPPSAPQGPLTEIYDEETGETRPLGEGPITPPKKHPRLGYYNEETGEIIKAPNKEYSHLPLVEYDEETGEIIRSQEEEKGLLTEIVDEKTGEVRPLGEIPGGIKPKEEYGTLSDFGMDFEEFNKLPEEDQKGLLRQLSPEEQKQISELQKAKKEADKETAEKSIEVVEQKAKEAILPKQKEAEGGLQGETEAKIKQAEQPSAETVTEPVEKQPVPAIPKKPIPKPQEKEKPSAKETGETIGETGREEGIEGGEEGRIRVRDTEKYGLETKTGKEIKTPKGVTAEVNNISQKANLKDPNVYEPVLDLDKKPTGWLRPKNNKSVLIDPESRKQVVFKAQKPKEATAKAKTNTAASGYAIKNPIISKEKPSEPTGKVSREAPVSPAKPTEGKAPEAKEEKKKVEPKEKPKFAKGKEETPVKAKPFYSPLLKATQNIKQDKFSAEQLKKVPGVKKAEWDWIGMDDFFKGKKSATKAEVEQFIAENQTEIEEVRKGETLDWKTSPSEAATKDKIGNLWEVKKDRNEYTIYKNGEVATYVDKPETQKEAMDAVESLIGISTKFSEWVEPGGENYREILITLPEVTDTYREGHYAETPNVIAHFRVNDREVNGEKVLFIEEIQSDWSKAARKAKDLDVQGPAYQPFLKNWEELTLKRILRMAAEEGYDRVAWITGEQTARRYDLSKKVNRVTWQPEDKFIRGYQDNTQVFAKLLESSNEIQNYIGKEPAKKILGQEPTTDELTGLSIQTIEGDDLKIGGQWAKNLYDKMIPNFLSKYGKKWDAKVETVDLNTGTQQSIPVTEAMKKSVLEEGQPLFAKKEEETKAEKLPERELSKEEKELTDIVYSSVDKEPKYGTIHIVDDVDPDSEIGTIGKVVEETTGKKVVFIKTDDRSLKPALGFTIDGLSMPEITKGKFKDTIFINVDSKRPLMWTAYHEFGHFLDANPNYNEKFWNAVKLTDKGMAELAKEGESEFAADIIGEMMSRQDFWENLAKENRTTVQKLMQEFLRIINEIRNSVRNIIASKQIPDAQIPQYESLLADVTAARDELARIYSDYRKTSGKEIGNIPAKMSATIRGEKAVFAKRKPEKKKKEYPVRKEPLNPFKRVIQTKVTDYKNVPKNVLESESNSERENEDVSKASNKSIGERLKAAEYHIGSWTWDRQYYAKQMLGKTPAAHKVIGKMNSVNGALPDATMQYDKAEKFISKNLPYELEDMLEKYIEKKRISEIEEIKGEGKVKHPYGETKELADDWIDFVENKIKKKDSLAVTLGATRYWAALRDQLKQSYDDGIISKRLFNRLKKEGRYYSPRMYLHRVDPARLGTSPSGRKISVRDSGIQALAQGSEKALVNNWRLLLSEVIKRTQARIYKNRAAKALAEFVDNNPDNAFGARLEPLAGRIVDITEAESIVDDLQGEVVKLQGSLAKISAKAQRDGIKPETKKERDKLEAKKEAELAKVEEKIDANLEMIDRWADRIEIAKEKGQENVFIDYRTQPELPDGMERIYYREDGIPKAILVPKEFADSWNNNDVAINHTLAQFLNFISGAALVRPFATGVGAPEFALSNVPRDMALQWIATQEYSRAAPVALVQNLRNFMTVFNDAWHGKGRYEDYVKQGGGMEFLNESGTFLRKDPTKPLTPLSSRSKRIHEWLRHFQEFSERLTRLALREQAINNGKTPEEATQIARGYIDFAQGGSLTKALDNAFPYLNAGVQGGRGLVRAAVTEPSSTAQKVGQLMMMGAALALIATKFRRKEWDETSDREKVQRWNFPLGMSYKNDLGEESHLYLSIPKDQSSRVFATFGEVVVELWQGAIDWETAWEKMKMAVDDLSPIDDLGMLPPSASAILGYIRNENFWKEEKIWKGRENISPYMEFYKGRTPEAYIDLSEKLYDIGVDLSPERLHQSLQQTLPKNPLSSLMGGAYEGVTATLSKEDKMELDKKVFQHWSQYPFIRKFIRATYPSKTDREKLAEKLFDYKIPLTNKKGQTKSETMLKHEIEAHERKINDIRQQHDNELYMLTELFMTGDKVKKRTVDQLVQLTADAEEKLGKKEGLRIARKIINHVNKNKNRDYFEKNKEELDKIIKVLKAYVDNNALENEKETE